MEYYEITRIFSDDSGESHFEDIKIPLKESGEIGFLSEIQAVSGIIFRKVNPHYDFDFHQAPARQYIVLQDGAIEIETSLGEKKTFEAGNVLLVEDTFGKGHRTRNLKEAVRSSIFVTLN